MSTPYRLAILGTMIALVLLVLAAIVGITLLGHQADSTPIVTSLLGFLATVVASLLALLGVDKVRTELNGQGRRIERIEESAEVLRETADRIEEGEHGRDERAAHALEDATGP